MALGKHRGARSPPNNRVVNCPFCHQEIVTQEYDDEACCTNPECKKVWHIPINEPHNHFTQVANQKTVRACVDVYNSKLEV